MKKLKILSLALIVLIGIVLMSTTSVRSARLVSRLDVDENLVTPTTSTFIEVNGLDETVTYTPGNTLFDADHLYADSVHHTGTIDLTALTNTLGESLNLTGDNIVAAKFKMTGTGTMVIANGASNSYPLGGTTYSFTLQPNQSLLFKADTILAPVSASLKTINYTGTSDASVLYIELLTAGGYH